MIGFFFFTMVDSDPIGLSREPTFHQLVRDSISSLCFTGR